MPNINITVAAKIATNTTPGEVIVCGNSDYTVTFAFDSEWAAEAKKTARFLYYKDGLSLYQDVAFTGNMVNVPALYEVPYVLVGVYAGSLRTTTPAKVLCDRSILCGNPLEVLTPEEKAGILAVVNKRLTQQDTRLSDMWEAHEDDFTASNNEMTEIWTALAELSGIVRERPTLATRSYWVKQGTTGITIPIADITEIHFVPTYAATGNEDESWAADDARAGTISGYRTGTVITISANGSDKIRANPTSTSMFGNMKKLHTVTGLELVDTSNITNMAAAFYNTALVNVDLSMWQLPKVTTANGMFNINQALKSVKFPRYGLPSLTSTTSVFDGCTNLVEVDMGRGLTALGDKMFYKCLNLEKVTGLGNVTNIGTRVFTYTPKLATADLRAKNIASVGESACRLSGIEDCVDLSAVALDNVEDMATRRKRWSAEKLAAIQNLNIPTVYINVPNSENQDNYTDIQFGTYDGAAVSVAEAGCSALALYHEWNAIHAGTAKEYASFRDWWTATIGATDFVANNTMDNSTISKMLAILGWTSPGVSFVEGTAQLETIIERLAAGLPTFVSMNSANVTDRTHAVLIVGGDSETRKFAIIDSKVTGTTGIVSWVSPEDIFVEGTAEKDYIDPHAYE